MRVEIFCDALQSYYFRGLYRLGYTGRIAHIDAIGLREIARRPYKSLRMMTYGTADRIIVGMAPYNLLAYYFLFLKKIKQPGSVVYSSSWPYWGTDRYRWRPIGPLIRTVWSQFLQGVKAVAPTDEALKGLDERGAHVYHVPHSVDTSVFCPKEHRQAGPVRILYVGRMMAHKGIGQLLDMARAMSGVDVEFWFVGKGPMVPEVQRAQESFRGVRYWGHIADEVALAEVYSQADVFVLPTQEELFGIVLIEAMACGLPVVTTDCVGPKEIVQNGVSGFVVPRQDANTLRQKVERLVADKALRENMGSYGRKLAEEKYDVRNVSEMWWEVLAP
jgi:glycosyltransferase involved in cell wall biosynthesis